MQYLNLSSTFCTVKTETETNKKLENINYQMARRLRHIISYKSHAFVTDPITKTAKTSLKLIT